MCCYSLVWNVIWECLGRKLIFAHSDSNLRSVCTICTRSATYTMQREGEHEGMKCAEEKTLIIISEVTEGEERTEKHSQTMRISQFEWTDIEYREAKK